MDRNLATLYGVETKRLKEQVRRNIERFPDDFMFVLSKDELNVLRSQSATSSTWGGSRYPPMAFTEQGVAMLSSVLNNKRAIDVNIAIMRTFVKLRTMLEANTKLAKKLAEIESKYDKQFSVIFDVLKELVNEPESDRKKIGFSAEEELAKYSSCRGGDNLGKRS